MILSNSWFTTGCRDLRRLWIYEPNDLRTPWIYATKGFTNPLIFKPIDLQTHGYMNHAWIYQPLDLLTHGFTTLDLPTHGFNNPLIYKLMDLPNPWFTNPWIYPSLNFRTHGFTHPLIYKSMDLPRPWFTNPLIYQTLDLRTHGCLGALNQTTPYNSFPFVHCTVEVVTLSIEMVHKILLSIVLESMYKYCPCCWQFLVQVEFTVTHLVNCRRLKCFSHDEELLAIGSREGIPDHGAISQDILAVDKLGAVPAVNVRI